MLDYSKLIFIVWICWTLRTCSADDNAVLCGLDTIGFIDYYEDYVTDTRNVTTEDGYILKVYCLYNPDTLSSTLNPVIAWHGLSDASHGFVINQRNQSLAFLLADLGYYVCLPNSRGTTNYSTAYVNNTRNSDLYENLYWQFTWDQIAEYDVPAVVDAVLLWTNKTKVIYIGHSQGSTTMFALLASKPQYNEKISIFVALAPVTYFSHNQSPEFQGLSNFEPLLAEFYGSEFMPRTSIETLLFFVTCTLPTEELCADFTFFLYGYSIHIDPNRLPVYLCHSPVGYAWGQLLQYLQHSVVDKFQKYDFGSITNQQEYGQSSPPQYDLSNVSAPVALYHSDGDLLTNIVDVQKLISELVNSIPIRDQRIPANIQFNHLDWVWGKDVYELVYSDVINLIKDY